MDMDTEDYVDSLINILIDKASEELAEYKQQVLQMSAQQIFDHSYETIIKNDFYCLFETKMVEMTPEAIKVLAQLPNPLDACYAAWLDNNLSAIDIASLFKTALQCARYNGYKSGDE